jgi:hypothetical protein
MDFTPFYYPSIRQFLSVRVCREFGFIAVGQVRDEKGSKVITEFQFVLWGRHGYRISPFLGTSHGSFGINQIQTIQTATFG